MKIDLKQQVLKNKKMIKRMKRITVGFLCLISAAFIGFSLLYSPAFFSDSDKYNKLSVLSLIISCLSLIVTIALNYSVNSYRKKRESNAKEVMLKAIENACQYYFFMTKRFKLNFVCKQAKDVFAEYFTELCDILESEKFFELSVFVNTIANEDVEYFSTYLKSRLQSAYQKDEERDKFVLVDNFMDCFNKKTVALINQLKDSKKPYDYKDEEIKLAMKSDDLSECCDLSIFATSTKSME